jgi:TPP-dependent pyruvate/acetoin dehydrogenase alpha subunit
LPIIFVILPDADGKSGNINLCAKARAAGIPGIPVDASDAIALYRVAQESIGRSRGGDGPVLIECTSSQLAEQRSSEISDPILYMKQFLIGRNISTEKWVNHVGDSFRKKLAKKL